MLVTLIAIALAQGPVQQPERLRTILPNEAVILVEPARNSKTLSLQLWALARGVEETPATHGMRHLLEHLMLKGQAGDLDARIETESGFLKAQTFRDAMQIDMTLPADKLDLGLEVLRELLKPLETTHDEIQRELGVMQQELALTDPAHRASIEAWRLAYGESGLDPLGSIDAMAEATPESLRLLKERHFAPRNLLVVLVGPGNLDALTQRIRPVLEGLVVRGDVPQASAPRQTAKGPEVGVSPADARAAPVGTYSDAPTAWKLSAALAAASELDGSFVTYTPSGRPGLVILGQRGGSSDLGMLDSMEPEDAERLYPRAKLLARAWVDSYLSTPSGTGYLRGLLMVQGSGYKPEQLLQNVDRMTLSEFKTGLRAFGRDEAVCVERPRS